MITQSRYCSISSMRNITHLTFGRHFYQVSMYSTYMYYVHHTIVSTFFGVLLLIIFITHVSCHISKTTTQTCVSNLAHRTTLSHWLWVLKAVDSALFLSFLYYLFFSTKQPTHVVVHTFSNYLQRYTEKNTN